MDKEKNEYYVYVYLDPRKKGNYEYGEYKFEYEPFYVGKGKGYRMERHTIDVLNDNICCNKFKYNVIKKILKTNTYPLTIKLIENLIDKDACNKEKEVIKLIGRRDKKLGPLTNLTDGGDGASGQIFSEEHKQKISDGLTGKKLSVAHKEKLSKAKKGKKIGKYSAEHKNKISNKLKGNKNAIKNKILQYDLTGNFIKEWNSASDITKDLKIDSSAIIKCCKNRIISSNGYTFRYKINNNISLIIELKKPTRQKKTIKSVYQIDLYTGIIIKKWNSIIDAEKGINKLGIYMAVKKQNKYCGGYYWCYVNEYKNYVFKKYEKQLPYNVLKIKQLNKDGILINEYCSIEEASIKTKLKYGVIYRYLTGIKPRKLEFIWEYA